MRTYPIPFNEEARLRALFSVPGLSEEHAPVFDAICEATRTTLGCPVAHISVVEDDTQWYKSVVGIELGRMPKENSFCAHTIMSGAPMVVPDLSKDPRFEAHPMVVEGGPQARFYAGVPLVLSSGQRFGSLCGLDFAPHEPPSDQAMAILADLGRATVAALEGTPPKPPADEGEDQLAKTTFITLVGHELRTPLTILFGSLRLIEGGVAAEVAPGLVRSARQSVEHLMGLIESIIAYSDAATGGLGLNERPCDLGALLDETAQLVLPAPGGALKGLSVAPDTEACTILADPDQLRMAINALVLNAVVHGGSEIEIACHRVEGGHVEIRLRDSGTLDEKVDLAALYEPFTVGGDIKRRGTRGGLGLGLPLTRKLVELHGGEFEVVAGPDSTTAVIRLPAWREKAARQSGAA